MWVSWFRESFSIATSMVSIPVSGFLIFSVEKFVWAPAPFQSPGMGFGSKETITPKSSATLKNIKLLFCMTSKLYYLVILGIQNNNSNSNILYISENEKKR